MTEEIELKKCPYCGENSWELNCDDFGATWFECKICGSASPYVISEDEDFSISEAKERLNTRPLEDNLTAENTKLRELIGELIEDGERLSENFTKNSGEGDCELCVHCGEILDLSTSEHLSDCAITKHRSLMSKVKEVLNG